MTLTLVDLDRQLGVTLKQARQSHRDDPARVTLSVLAAPRPEGVTDALRRTWLRARGGSAVRSLLADTSNWRRLLADASDYVVSPIDVRRRVAERLVAALTHALSANEARLLALLALDMLTTGRDSAQVTRRFDVVAGTTRATTMRAVKTLSELGVLTVTRKQTGVPTAVRLARVAPTTGWTSDVGQLVEAIADDDRTNDAYRTLLTVTSPVLGYLTRDVDGRVSGFPVDGWYMTILDLIGARIATIPAPRASRARRALRDLGIPDDPADFADAIAAMETDDVRRRYAKAESERAAAAEVRGASAQDARGARRAAWKALEALGAPALPNPKTKAADARRTEWIKSVGELVKAAPPEQLPALRDVIRRALIGRGWDEEQRAKALRKWFGEWDYVRKLGIPATHDDPVTARLYARTLPRLIARCGPVPARPTSEEAVATVRAWVSQVAAAWASVGADAATTQAFANALRTMLTRRSWAGDNLDAIVDQITSGTDTPKEGI